MAYTWGLRPTGIQTHNDGATIPYRLIGEPDGATARVYALLESPATFGAFYRKDVRCNGLGAGIWDVDVEYGDIERKEPKSGDFKWNFDTTGATKHITQGLEHVATYPESGAPYDHKGAIGVTDNSVEGTDIPDHSFRWNETWQLPIASYGFIYSAILGQLNGRVNASYFRGFPAHTVRFDGASGSRSPQDSSLIEITYNFAQSQSESGLSVGDITGISKAGWDYLWVRYRSTENATLKTTELKPVQVEIDRVFTSFNFSLLGIGTGILP